MIGALFSDEPAHPRGWPYRIALCGAYELRQGFVAWEGTHIISIGRRELRVGGSPLPDDRHLCLEFDDVTDTSRHAAPTTGHLETAMAFVDRLPSDAVLVIHCLQGISRSTGLTLGLLAREAPPLRAGFLLHGLRPFACPNPLLVRLWDDLLDLGGELVDVASLFPTVVWRHGDGRSKPDALHRHA